MDNFFKAIEASDSDGNLKKADVLIRLDENDDGEIEIKIESLILTKGAEYFWIFETIIPQNYPQAFDIIQKFDSVSACNFLDRIIADWGIKFD